MYAQDNYNKVRDIIEARRSRAINDAQARSEALRSESAELDEIDRELSRTGLLIFKTACDGGDIAPIKERNIALNARRKQVLLDMGYPEDYTDVKFTCKKCGDTGYVDIHMCSCFRELLLTENIRSSGIGKLIEQQSFDNFDLSFFGENTEERHRAELILKRAKGFAESFGTKERGVNLLLIGKTGTGKTHISTAIARRIIERGYFVLYDSAQNIVSAFENDRFHSGYGHHESTADKYLECDLLIIDDLGTEFVNQFTTSCLYNLFNTRRNRGLSTIISTNLSATELSTKYDDRICSRIIGSDYKVLYFEGRDYRIYGPKK